MTLDEATQLEADGKIKIHDLKCWTAYFEAVDDGRKNFEIRRDDRGYQKGDVLRIREWDDKPSPVATGSNHTRSRGYTGNETYALVRYVLTGGQFGLEPGYVAMALEAIEE